MRKYDWLPCRRKAAFVVMSVIAVEGGSRRSESPEGSLPTIKYNSFAVDCQ